MLRQMQRANAKKAFKAFRKENPQMKNKLLFVDFFKIYKLQEKQDNSKEVELEEYSAFLSEELDEV